MAIEEMTGIQSQVTFNAGGGGAIINVGEVDGEAKKVDVYWATQQAQVLVYSSLTPNLPAQSAITASAVSGTNYTLKLILVDASRTQTVYTATPFLATPGTIVVKILNQV